MANRYYLEGERRAEGVHDLFAAVAARYDLVNDLQSLGLHRWWKRRVVRLANVRPGDRALDLCCGTGDLAFALAREGARVTGVDFSEAMLAVARQRAPRVGSPPQFLRGDALALEFPDRSFDGITMAYGLRNLRDLDQGLREMNRVARAGGRVVILDFGKPRNRIWRALYFAHLRTAVPLLGRLFCGDADTHAYILESLRRYPEPGEIARRLETAGWREVQWWPLLGGVMTIHSGLRAR